MQAYATIWVEFRIILLRGKTINIQLHHYPCKAQSFIKLNIHVHKLNFQKQKNKAQTQKSVNSGEKEGVGKE